MPELSNGSTFVAMAPRARLLLLAAALLLPVTIAEAQNCDGTSVGLTPLNDLGSGLYDAHQGGLYPGGSNVRPAAYEALLQPVTPLGADGSPDPDGDIVLLSIGMSNAQFEFDSFITLAQADPDLNPQLRIVNGAVSGQDATDTASPTGPYWTWVDEFLTEAGVTPQQVQVIWLKNTRANPSEPFPQFAELLRDDLRSVVQIIETRYPNVKAIYVSSRIYAGYATVPLNPEPWAYQSGFAFKWLIEERIDGSVDGPWIAWGPYLWADGLTARNDGLTWVCEDFNSDGTHPSNPQGRDKVGGMLLDFFSGDATTQPWFHGAPSTEQPPAPPQNLVVD